MYKNQTKAVDIMENKNSKKIFQMVSIALMAALVFIFSNFQFKIPVAVGPVTRIHLGNTMCLLAGLLFGGLPGGFAAGIGSAIFDLLDPNYAPEFGITFLTKFAMGFFCGFIAHKLAKKHSIIPSYIIGAIIGQVIYIILYLLKSFIFTVLEGNAINTALVAVGTKAITSSVNATIAIVLSLLLVIPLKKGLTKTKFSFLLNKN